MTDIQLFDRQFKELVSELTEDDMTDPVLTDALNRLKEVPGIIRKQTCGLIS